MTNLLLIAGLLFSFGLTLDLPGCNQSIPIAQPVPVVQLQPVPNGTPFDPAATWRPLDRDDLLARMILSEAAGRVLILPGQMDAVGMAWVALNRTRGLQSGFDYALGDLHAALTRPGQFQGMAGVRSGEQGNATIVANPEIYDVWFGAQPRAGRFAYWIARTIARCVLSGHVPDPTHGALFFSDGRYARDASGNLIHNSDGNLIVEPWPDGRTHFRPSSDSPSYAIDLTPFIPDDGRRR